MESLEKQINLSDIILQVNPKVRLLCADTISDEISALFAYVRSEANSIRRNKKISAEEKAAEMLALESRALEVFDFLDCESKKLDVYFPDDVEDNNTDDWMRLAIDTEMCETLRQAHNIDTNTVRLAADLGYYLKYHDVPYDRDDTSWIGRANRMLDNLDQNSLITGWLRRKYQVIFARPFLYDDIEATA